MTREAAADAGHHLALAQCAWNKVNNAQKHGSSSSRLLQYTSEQSDTLFQSPITKINIYISHDYRKNISKCIQGRNSVFPLSKTKIQGKYGKVFLRATTT